MKRVQLYILLLAWILTGVSYAGFRQRLSFHKKQAQINKVIEQMERVGQDDARCLRSGLLLSTRYNCLNKNQKRRLARLFNVAYA